MMNHGSLAGIKVIDLSRVLGGPFCSQVLADHGAEVIKVEPPSGDDTRWWGPPFQEGSAAYFSGLNRNKRGLVLDLSRAEGQAVLRTLLADADVLVENFKIGTLEKWGLGYDDTLAEAFPRLIHCRISGFGADGPLGGLPGYDTVIQAMAGIMSMNGEATGDPLRVGVPVVDMVCGLNASIGILLALQARQHSGRGQFVEAALYDSGVSLLHPHIPNHLMSGALPLRSGNAHPNIAPYDAHQTQTVPIYLAVGNNAQFMKLCQHLGLSELVDDDRFIDNARRCAHRAALKQVLEAAMRSLDGQQLATALIQAGVPCGPILNVAEVVAHPHTVHRNLLVDIGADYRGTASPIKLSQNPASYRLPPPVFGADSVTVLQQHGYEDEAIAQLRADGVIKTAV
ncbi:MAG: CoA transferase [Neisseriaceae bacterium]|nr:CoA transferase [Neisseriaceae bacterium]